MHKLFVEFKTRDFFNTRLLVSKHVKICVDEWILETTRPHKHVTIFGIFEYTVL